MLGLAFSTSSSSTTEYGLSFSWFVSTPPRSDPTMPRGMPISLSTATAPSWYSDMSTRIIFFSSPNRNSATDLASSVLPTPVGPRNSSTPSGRSNPSLSGPLFSTRRRATASIASRWPTTRVAEARFDVAEPIRHLAEHHVLGDPRDLRDHVDDVRRRRLPSGGRSPP